MLTKIYDHISNFFYVVSGRAREDFYKRLMARGARRFELYYRNGSTVSMEEIEKQLDQEGLYLHDKKIYNYIRNKLI